MASGNFGILIHARVAIGAQYIIFRSPMPRYANGNGVPLRVSVFVGGGRAVVAEKTRANGGSFAALRLAGDTQRGD